MAKMAFERPKSFFSIFRAFKKGILWIPLAKSHNGQEMAKICQEMIKIVKNGHFSTKIFSYIF